MQRPTTGRWPRAAIFDCDGLLVDTTASWRAALADVAADGEVPPEGVLGGSPEQVAERASARLSTPIDPVAYRSALVRRAVTDPGRARPGAVWLLSVLYGTIPLAVASNAPFDLVDDVLRHTGLRRFFDHVVSADDVGSPKPDPAVYQRACRLVGEDPSDSVAFEDSPMGVASASRAGLFVIGVPAGEQRLDADLVVRELHDDRVARVLGLRANAAATARSRAAAELEAVRRRILARVGPDADGEELFVLAAELHGVLDGARAAPRTTRGTGPA